MVEQTKPISPYSYIIGNTIKTKEPKRIINFHHSRDRLKEGHTEDEGMFNYEALTPGQIFKGEIHGDPKNLEKLKDIFGEKFLAWLRKSRNTRVWKSRNTTFRKL